MLSPMMRQYMETKEEVGDALLFYQLGDFYEMFFEDAKICSKVLELTLTGRDCGLEERAPMCGIPIHAIDSYVSKLVEAGYKVALCSQMSEPNGKELVKRQIVKIVTAGTLTENVDEKTNNYIASVSLCKNTFGVAYADITTGKLNLIEVESTKKLEDVLVRISPSEIIVDKDSKEIEPQLGSIKIGSLPKFTNYLQHAFGFERSLKLCKKHFGVASLSVYDIDDNMKAGIQAVGGLLEYLNDTQKRSLSNINKITLEKESNYMHMDSNVRKNLELIENMNTKKKKGSLLGILDKTQTAMGARLIKTFIQQPLQNEKSINARLDAVEELSQKTNFVSNIKACLEKIYDIERLAGKIAYGSISPRECISLANSLQNVDLLKNLLINEASAPLLKYCVDKLVDTKEVTQKIQCAIDPNAPINLKDGGYIKHGYDNQLDVYRSSGTMGKQWLAELETREKEKTGIKNLKLSYNRVFGYYLEVTKSQISLVPDSWNRRQTTVNGERYITPELKEMESKILNCEDLALKLESTLYSEIKEFLLTKIKDIQSVSNAIALLDVLISFSVVANEYHYCKPVISATSNKIEIVEGRHPVIESLLPSGEFVSNDTLLDTDANRTIIITGPNMAGKSTYMRQVAIITIMAHMGCFVPAKKAEISIVDRIFTRIGASDDLAYGQSTFMVEMIEVANILANATKRSLVILDEIGRGTSTYDGLSIAWSVIEYLSNNISAKTLFATHYHELTDLEGRLEGVKNFRVLVKELSDSVVFLHKIARGSANKSFGIEVAKLAGLPSEIIKRSKEILYLQENANESASKKSFDDKTLDSSKTKKNLNINEILNILTDLDMDTVSPLIAFSTLQNLVDKVKKVDEF